jgi:hypothetical protein
MHECFQLATRTSGQYAKDFIRHDSRNVALAYPDEEIRRGLAGKWQHTPRWPQHSGIFSACAPASRSSGSRVGDSRPVKAGETLADPDGESAGVGRLGSRAEVSFDMIALVIVNVGKWRYWGKPPKTPGNILWPMMIVDAPGEGIVSPTTKDRTCPQGGRTCVPESHWGNASDVSQSPPLIERLTE